MTPIEFPEQTVVFAKDQKPYLPLPAHRTEDGMVTSCWKMNWVEWLRVLLGGKVYVTTMTFNMPLQPLKVNAVFPEEHR